MDGTPTTDLISSQARLSSGLMGHELARDNAGVKIWSEDLIASQVPGTSLQALELADDEVELETTCEICDDEEPCRALICVGGHTGRLVSAESEAVCHWLCAACRAGETTRRDVDLIRGAVVMCGVCMEP